LLKDRLLAEGILAAGDILQPEPIDAPTLEFVDTREYLAKLAPTVLAGGAPPEYPVPHTSDSP
jgi:hypothetical protein